VFVGVVCSFYNISPNQIEVSRRELTFVVVRADQYNLGMDIIRLTV
jgi:hypothetical protein